LNTDSVGNLLSFSTPTSTHISDTHSHGYGHFGTPTCGVQWSAGNRFDKWFEAFGTVTDSGEIMTFKLVIIKLS
jgi:hypothetical protein